MLNFSKSVYNETESKQGFELSSLINIAQKKQPSHWLILVIVKIQNKLIETADIHAANDPFLPMD